MNRPQTGLTILVGNRGGNARVAQRLGLDPGERNSRPLGLSSFKSSANISSAACLEQVILKDGAMCIFLPLSESNNSSNSILVRSRRALSGIPVIGSREPFLTKQSPRSKKAMSASSLRQRSMEISEFLSNLDRA